MTKPASNADLQTQKATTVDLFTGDIEDARRNKVVLLNLLDDQSARAVGGVTSFVLHDMEDLGSEDTKQDGTAQSDLSGGVAPTTLAINAFKTVPAYFKYIIHGTSEDARIDFIGNFVQAAPSVAILNVEAAAIVALRAIGSVAGHYKQLSGANSAAVANAVPTVADYSSAISKLCVEKKLDQSELFSVGDDIMKLELPNLFGLYAKEATGPMGEMAKLNGYSNQMLGIPHFTSKGMLDKEIIVAHKRAVAWAIRSQANLIFESQGSKNQDYYGVNISYGVVARQDNRAFVMQNGVAWSAS